MAAKDVTALILCGGRSLRMGEDKAQLEVAGTAMLQSALDVVEQVAGQVLLACGPEPRYGDLGIELVLDEIPDRGPLEGLRAGLAAMRSPWLLAVACDMPYLSPELFPPLMGAAAESGVDLVHYLGEDGSEPLCALYSHRVLPAVTRSLREDRRRMDGFWNGCREDGRPLVVRTVNKPGVESAGRGENHGKLGDPFFNVNTPADLQRAIGHTQDQSP